MLDKDIRKAENELVSLHIKRYIKIRDLVERFPVLELDQPRRLYEPIGFKAIRIMLNNRTEYRSSEYEDAAPANEGWYFSDELRRRVGLKNVSGTEIVRSLRTLGLVEERLAEIRKKKKGKPVKRRVVALKHSVSVVLKQICDIYLERGIDLMGDFVGSDYYQRTKESYSKLQSAYRNKQEELYTINGHTESLYAHPLIDRFWCSYLANPRRVKRSIDAFKGQISAKEYTSEQIWRLFTFLVQIVRDEEQEEARLSELLEAYVKWELNLCPSRSRDQLPWRELESAKE